MLCIVIQQSLADDNYSKYTLSREMLQHAGLVRLSDIFNLIDEWDNYSVEGYTQQGISNSFDIYQQQNWIILVDGHRMDTKLFDINNINLLPFSTNQIDSIEIYDIPRLVEDAFSDRGIIHIHSRQMKDGLTLQGQFTAGNQTGDPGPYRYTEFWSENVDRIAADESYWLSHRGDVGYFGAGYYAQIYYPTDPLIVERNRDIYPYANPVIKTYSYNLRAGLSKLFSRPRVDVVYSLIDDFYFFKPFGREIPVKNHFLSVGLIGNTDFSNQLMIGYKFRYSGNSLKKRENASNIDFNWSLERFYANIHSIFNLSGLAFKLGMAAEKTKVATNYKLTQNQINDGIVFSSINLNQDSGSYLNVDAEFRFNQHETGIKIAATNLWKVKADQGIFTNIAYSQTMTNIENSLWYWSERGYDFVRDQGGDYTIRGTLRPARKWSFDLYWLRDEDILPAIKTGILFHGFLRKNWEEQPFQYEFISKTVSGPVSVKTGQRGQMGAIYFKLSYSNSSRFEHQFYYRYAIPIGKNGLFSKIRDEIPESLFIYRITYKPVKNFSIWVMCKYVSTTFWTDFKDIDQQSDGLYSSHLSDIFLIDIAINKWMWKRQIKVDLILRNLFNNKNISYPIGASPNLRFYAQAEMYFNFW
jgi:hypothetical protein